MRTYFHLVFVAIAALFIPVHRADNAVELTTNSFEHIVGTTELVLVNFYANWCKFSRMLAPVFEETAKALQQKYPDESKVKLARVDCEREIDVAKRYGVNKYPTIKLFKNGRVQKREYRGQRSTDAITQFLVKQMESPVKEITNLDDLDDILDKRKQNIIGYFDTKDQVEYKQFDKVAGMLREDCQWYSAFGEVSQSQRPGGGFQIVYKPPNTEHNEKLYSSHLKSHEMFLNWATDKCVPLVRTITFENAEEMTEEGLPFLILFHHPEDTESVVKYTDVIHKHLVKEKETVNFLVADGLQFAHPLHHMGKSGKDLPVLAIDSFKHMYVFPHKDKLYDPDALLQFIKDLQSGKLHREFHHGPDQTQAPPRQVETKPTPPPTQKSLGGDTATDEATEASVEAAKKQPVEHIPKTPDQPPESQFAKLKPSDMRYSFKDNPRDEL